MQIRLLKKIVSDVAGTEAEKIVDLLYDKKNVNEFLIAKKLSLTINQTRNILYKLADEGLVTFIRKKDKKKGGWYTYFWTLSTGRSLIKFKEKILKNTEQLQHQLNSRATKKFFICKNCGIEYNEENALIHEYTCPECGEVLLAKDNEQVLKQIKDEISKHERVLQDLTKEIKIIQTKEEKAKTRRLKADQKKKVEERKRKTLARKREREKEKRKEDRKRKKGKIGLKKKKVRKKSKKKQ